MGSVKERRRHKPLYKSFGYAFKGIGVTIKEERNIKIHISVMLLVIIFGVWLHISTIEWLICFVLFGLVISLELVNTAVENVVDLVTTEKRPLAGKAKDAAAGAVLVAAIFAGIIGCIIFLPKLIGVFL